MYSNTLVAPSDLSFAPPKCIVLESKSDASPVFNNASTLERDSRNESLLGTSLYWSCAFSVFVLGKKVVGPISFDTSCNDIKAVYSGACSWYGLSGWMGCRGEPGSDINADISYNVASLSTFPPPIAVESILDNLLDSTNISCNAFCKLSFPSNGNSKSHLLVLSITSAK